MMASKVTPPAAEEGVKKKGGIAEAGGSIISTHGYFGQIKPHSAGQN